MPIVSRVNELIQSFLKLEIISPTIVTMKLKNLTISNLEIEYVLPFFEQKRQLYNFKFKEIY
jgi:hypothetical protein